MPRLIDHDAREREIAEAALDVLGREGLAGLSVRGVAAEAGLAVASLRRAFPTQNALRHYCLDLIRARAAARIEAVQADGTAWAAGVLRELLPLDAERRLELVAQLQLGVLALTDESLRPAGEGLVADVRAVCAVAVAELERTGGVRPHVAMRDVVDELHAFLDGLALQALLSPAASTPAVVEARLDGYLERLRAAP